MLSGLTTRNAAGFLLPELQKLEILDNAHGEPSDSDLLGIALFEDLRELVLRAPGGANCLPLPLSILRVPRLGRVDAEWLKRHVSTVELCGPRITFHNQDSGQDSDPPSPDPSLSTSSSVRLGTNPISSNNRGDAGISDDIVEHFLNPNHQTGNLNPNALAFAWAMGVDSPGGNIGGPII